MTTEQDNNSQNNSLSQTSDSGTPSVSMTGSDALMDSTNFNVDIPETTSVTRKRKFRPMRFTMGLTLTTISVSLIMWIAIRMLDVHYLGGRFALGLVAFVVVSSVMMLGAGFGLMATAAADFDDSEFEHLIRSGNISASEVVMTEAAAGTIGDSSNHRNAA